MQANKEVRDHELWRPQPPVPEPAQRPGGVDDQVVLTNPLALAPILTPQGRLTLRQTDDTPALDAELARRLQDAFARGAGHGLLQLGAGEVGTSLPPVFSYWREFGARYVTGLCTLPAGEASQQSVHIPFPPNDEVDRLASAAPLMTGAEYLTADTLRALWQELDKAFALELAESKISI
ncbi:MAG: hypothetical protein ACRD18_00075, partial [Terriglobia bacterium]